MRISNRCLAALALSSGLCLSGALVVPSAANAAESGGVYIPHGTVVDANFDPSTGGSYGGDHAPQAAAINDSKRGPRSGDCKWRQAGALPGGGWSGASTGCYLIGTTKNTTVTYFWRPASDIDSCVQGKGFNANAAPVWQSAGCLGGGNTTILWGNVAANKQVKVKSLSVVTGSKVEWE